MKKILITNAIIQENIYDVDNHYMLDYNETLSSIKGRLKIISFDKFKLNREKVNENIEEEFFSNIIGKIELEYTNLNQYENDDCALNSFYLSDLDNFRFKRISSCSVIIAIAEHFGKERFYYSVDKLIPKIKKTITLFYLLPDEETDYFLELKDGTIEEV